MPFIANIPHVSQLWQQPEPRSKTNYFLFSNVLLDKIFPHKEAMNIFKSGEHCIEISYRIKRKAQAQIFRNTYVITSIKRCIRECPVYKFSIINYYVKRIHVKKFSVIAYCVLLNVS